MPYIPQDRRTEVLEHGAETVGELNFLLSHAISLYRRKEITRKQMARAMKVSVYDFVTSQALSYQVVNDVLGAILGASLEYVRLCRPASQRVVRTLSDLSHDFYVDVAVPYEDQKRELNGGVYDGA